MSGEALFPETGRCRGSSRPHHLLSLCLCAGRTLPESAGIGSSGRSAGRPKTAAALSRKQRKSTKQSVAALLQEVEQEAENALRKQREKEFHPKESTQAEESRCESWAIVVAVVAIATCIILVIYVKLLFDQTVERQSQKAVQILEEDDYGLSPEQVDEFSVSVQNIKEQATTIVDNLNTYTEKRHEGKVFLL